MSGKNLSANRYMYYIVCSWYGVWIEEGIKNLLALVQVVHVGGSSKVFVSVLGSMTLCVLFVCTMYCSDVHKAIRIDFGTCRLTLLIPYQILCSHRAHCKPNECGGNWWIWREVVAMGCRSSVVGAVAAQARDLGLIPSSFPVLFHIPFSACV